MDDLLKLVPRLLYNLPQTEFLINYPIHNGAAIFWWNNHIEVVIINQPTLVEILFHSVLGPQECDSLDSPLFDLYGGGVSNMERLNGDGALDFWGHLVHGVRTDQDTVSPTSLDALSSITHELCCLRPSTFCLQC